MTKKPRPPRSSGNPPDSPWYSTPSSARKKPGKLVQLGAEDRKRLARLKRLGKYKSDSATIRAALVALEQHLEQGGEAPPDPALEQDE
jgi:hypothetical protein